MTTCGDISGCWAQDVVNIGWYGYRTNSSTFVRVGPGHNFNMRSIIAPGKRMGWQSVRNPDALDSPAQRSPKNGFAWCYLIDGSLTGWVPVGTIDEYDNGKSWAHGPAESDFHVGYDECERGSPAGCGGYTMNHNLRVVKTEEVYVRYAPQSTAFHFLLKGDHFKEMYASPMGYRCGEVTQSESCPVGTRGWVLSAALQ